MSTITSSLVRFFLSSMGNREAMQGERQETTTHYIKIALRGNSTQWNEAYSQVILQKPTGQHKKVIEATQAAFNAIGSIPVMFKPQEKPEKKAMDEAIDKRANELFATFEAAYVAVLPMVEIKPTKEEADAKKAEKEADKEAKFQAKVKELNLVPADSLEKVIATDADILAGALALIGFNKCGETMMHDFLQAIATVNPDLVAQFTAEKSAIAAKQEIAKTAKASASLAEKKASKKHADILAQTFTLPATKPAIEPIAA